MKEYFQTGDSVSMVFSFTRPVSFINFAQACLFLKTVSQVSNVSHGILLNANISALDSVTLVTIKTYLHLVWIICIT